MSKLTFRIGQIVPSSNTTMEIEVPAICADMKPLTKLVVDYESEGVTVKDYIALEIPDNLEVGLHDPRRLLEIYKKLDRSGIDALVASACVQMPSLPAIERIEQQTGIPTVSAAVCTAHQMMTRLGLEAQAPGAGALLSASQSKRAASEVAGGAP